MTTVTDSERMILAKSGVAMPDGSYYVRNGPDLDHAINAVGRGEAAGDDGDAIRRHIMKRAVALKMEDRIPDTWNPDGSLKHEEDPLAKFLAHHGVLGMKWGHRKEASAEEEKSDGQGVSRNQAKHDALVEKAKDHEALSAAHAHASMAYQNEAEEVLNKGQQSAAFKRVYGNFAPQQSDWEFYGKNGQSKAQAMQQLHNNLRLLANHHARRANSHSKKAAKLREKAQKLEHGEDLDILKDLVSSDEMITESLEHADGTDQELAHFGVLGMKWGHRKEQSSQTAPSDDFARARETAGKVREGGTRVVSNEELQHLVNRLRLEQEYAKLSEEKVNSGRKFLKARTADAKTILDVADTGIKFYKIAKPLIDAAAKQ